MIGSLAALSLPGGAEGGGPPDPFRVDPLQQALLKEYRIEVPVF